MERKYLEQLVEWTNDPERKPLMVWGARQVGKTYLVRDMFAERYYKGRYVYVDCKSDYRFSEYCNGHPNVDDVLRYISISNGVDIDSETLLIFDEAQECPAIVTLMKYFCQDHREIPVIVTGSMVRIRIKRAVKRGTKGFLFPIGKIDQITVYPMTFDEYMFNRNRNLYDLVKKSYDDKVPMEKTYHEMAMRLFHEYVLIGGMPEVADNYIRTGNFNQARKLLKNLYENYLDDMELYQASSDSVVRSRAVFSKIFSELNTGSKNFKSTSVGEDLRHRDLLQPLDWLMEAHIVQRSQQKKDHVSIPLMKNDGGLYRLFLCDMGMFTFQSNVDPTTFIDDRGCNTLSGIFYENYVAIELSARGFDLFYWNGTNAEMEFIIEQNSAIVPMDVKKKRGSMGSLDRFKDNNLFDYAIKISANRYGFDEDRRILTVPFYDFPFLADDLKDGKRPVD